MSGPNGPQGPSGVDKTKRGYVVEPVTKLPCRPSVGITPGMSLDAPSAPPPSAPPPSSNGLIAPAPPPRAPRQLGPQLPPMPMRISTQAPPLAYDTYIVEGVSDVANKLVQAAARDLPTEQSFVSTERIIDALFAYWQEQCTFLRVEGEQPKSAWTYDDVVSGRVVLENDYAALLASAEELWIDQGKDETRREEESYMEYMREILTQKFDAESIPYYFNPDLTQHPREVKLIQAFHGLASALLFYKSAQVVDDPLNKNVLLTSGASMAGEKAMCRFSDMKVPSVIKNYSSMLLTLKIAPAIVRVGMR